MEKLSKGKVLLPRNLGIILKKCGFSVSECALIFYVLLRCDLRVRPYISLIKLETLYRNFTSKASLWRTITKLRRHKHLTILQYVSEKCRKNKNLIFHFKFMEQFSEEGEYFDYYDNFKKFASQHRVTFIKQYKVMFYFREYIVKYFGMKQEEVNCYSKMNHDIMKYLLTGDVSEKWFKTVIDHFKIDKDNLKIFLG